MQIGRGIYTHLNKFYESQLAQSQAPNQALLGSLQSLLSIAKQKQNNIKLIKQSRSELAKNISYEEALQLKQNKEKLSKNQQILKIVSICRQIDMRIIGFQENIEESQLVQSNRLQETLSNFRQLYVLIEKLDQQFTLMTQKQSKKADFSTQQANNLKSTYFNDLKSKLYRGIIQLFYSHNRNQLVEQSLQYFNLPIRKSKNQAKNNNSNEQQHQQLQDNTNKFKDASFLRNAYCIIQALFFQYCCYCLTKKIQMILGQQQKQNQNQQFVSPFFQKLWQKVNKSITYIFMNSPNLNEQNSAYQIDQPNWLFQYMELTFRLNYNYIDKNILGLIRGDSEIKQITEYIQTYFVAYNMPNFFLKFIIMRLEVDTKLLKQNEKAQKKQSQQQKNKTAFLIFNFLDQLNILSQKLQQTYDNDTNFMQNVLLWTQTNSPLNVLALNFDYQHNWIQQRIFNDFSNINYSNIADLKNIEAYNITVNFTHIFQKLYAKFRKISTSTSASEHIKQKINSFYYDKILQLVRHIVTSFQRIYNYSGIDKYEILMSYKKVQDQFKGYFNGFIGQKAVFQNKIREQYYSVLEKYSTVLALQQLTPCHKRIYKKLSENNDIFIKTNLQGQELSDNKASWNKIFEQWQQKVNKINRIQANYEDKKLRNIFFVFLQSVQFSQDGLFYFLSLFQPFLVILFTVQGSKIIRTLLEMQKGTFKEYCKSHQNSIWFLSSSQLKSIQKVKIKSK